MKEQYFAAAAANPWAMVTGIIVVALAASLIVGILYWARRLFKNEK